MPDFTPIPQADLDAMQAREEAATEGPWELKERMISREKRGWEVHARLSKTTIKPIIYGYTATIIGSISEFINNENNGLFCVHARTDQPRLRISYEALLAEHKKLQIEVVALREINAERIQEEIEADAERPDIWHA